MEIEAGRDCGELRYKAEGDPPFKGQCHCRECQYASGGGPNYVMALPEAGFSEPGESPRVSRAATSTTGSGANSAGNAEPISWVTSSPGKAGGIQVTRSKRE